MTKKANFDYEIFSNEDGSFVCFNKAKYTKEQALELGKKELAEAEIEYDIDDIEVREGYVANRCMHWEGENCVGLVLYETSEKPRGGVPVWVVN